jgi:glycosyltransferase involved in cell wall biosynthesis
VFVGAFNERKGVLQLLETWPTVSARRPSARLRVLGKGPLRPVVEAAAAADPSIQVEVDPGRAAIHAALRRAKVAVLLSQPWRGWREQVGLPIVEALAHGCHVIATDQTGLADWLRAHGHTVVPASASTTVVADALVTALDSCRSAESVLEELPDRDGRLAADEWMFAASEGCPPGVGRPA